MNKFEKYLNEATGPKKLKILLKKNIQELLSNLGEISNSDEWKEYEKDAIKLQKQLEDFYKIIR